MIGKKRLRSEVLASFETDVQIKVLNPEAWSFFKKALALVEGSDFNYLFKL